MFRFYEIVSIITWIYDIIYRIFYLWFYQKLKFHVGYRFIILVFLVNYHIITMFILNSLSYYGKYRYIDVCGKYVSTYLKSRIYITAFFYKNT